MPTFKATLKREVTVVERADILLEADTQAEAEENAVALAIDKDDLTWTETDVSESTIGEPNVEKVVIHAYSASEEVVDES